MKSSLSTAARISAMHREHLCSRITAQLDFADFLCRTHPACADVGRRAIAETHAALADAFATAGTEALQESVSQAEAHLAPLSAQAKQYIIYCAGHAHIDMNWQWSWPETVAITLDTLETMLSLMDHYPAFHFTQSQASIYEIVERHRPDLLARIRAHVRSGRWEVAASHWVECDKNLVSGEALCRHLLETRSAMWRLFALEPEAVPIDWAPDTFGHSADGPTYLTRGAVRFVYMHRPGHLHHDCPEAFRWESPDGARVLVRNDMRGGYNGSIGPGIVDRLRMFHAQTGLPFCLYVFGVGDHGGGPTRRDLEMIQEMSTWPVFPSIEPAPARRFFERLDAEGDSLPVICGELNAEFTGCYTSQARIKRANRIGENRLVDTEWAVALQYAVNGARRPAGRLDPAWRQVLFSQFHDILPGSGVLDTLTFALGSFQQAMADTTMIERAALRAVTAHVATATVGRPLPDSTLPAFPVSFLRDATGAGSGMHTGEAAQSTAAAPGGVRRAFVVFNPSPVERGEVVTLTVWENEPRHTPLPFHGVRFRARLADGTERMPQVLSKGDQWGHLNQVLALPLAVPAMGYTTVVLEPCEAKDDGPDAAPAPVRSLHHPHACCYSEVERDRIGIENESLRAVFDPRTGALRELTDLRRGLQLITPFTARPNLEFAIERPHPMSAWLIAHAGPVEHPALTSVRRVHNGPWRVSIEMDFRIQHSTVRICYTLDAGDPRLHADLTIDWNERGNPGTGTPNLRLVWPFALTAPRMSCSIPFGAIQRDPVPDAEQPTLQWTAIEGQGNGGNPVGCLLLNDCKYGHAAEGATLRINLLRASYDPDPHPDAGRHTLHVALLPFDGPLNVAAAMRAGQAVNHALIPLATPVQAGDWPAEASLINVEPEHVVLSIVKVAEDGNGWIARVIETAGRPCQVRLTPNPDRFGPLRTAVATDLLERPGTDAEAWIEAGAACIKLPAYGLATVRLGNTL